MRVLVAYGSKLGGTQGIAEQIGEGLRDAGHEVVVQPAARCHDVWHHDAAVIGGALYGNRWHRDAARLVARNVKTLRDIPVWLFSSGPLDASADGGGIAPTRQVAVLMERIGAVDHVTFGGRLPADAKGFPASAMAKTNAGDWRNPEHIHAFTEALARALPHARPRVAHEPKGRSIPRWLAYGLAGWAACAAIMAGLMQVSPRAAVITHAVLAPLVFVAVAVSYFRARGARSALLTALGWTLLVVGLDAGIVAALILRSFAMFRSVVGTWLPITLIFLFVWATGALMSTLPWPRPPRQETRRRAHHAPLAHGA